MVAQKGIYDMMMATGSSHERSNLNDAHNHLVLASKATNEDTYDQHMAAAQNSLQTAGGDLL